MSRGLSAALLLTVGVAAAGPVAASAIVAGSVAGSAASSAASSAAAPAVVAGGADRARIRVIASGLDNPRGLAFGPGGELYVAEAGHGGSAPCRPGSRGELRCFGRSGAITVLRDGRQRRMLLHLPSTALPSGAEAVGPADVAVGPGGELHYVAGSPGTVLSAYDMGNERSVSASPGSAPVAVIASDRGLVVADAGVGALLRVGPKGRAQVVARIPALTSVARGPDGVFYASERRRIWRVEPGRAPVVHAAGFVGVVDLAWSEQGLVVLESSGDVVRVTSAGARRVATGLPAPGGLAVRDRHAYVSTCAVCGSTGEVVRIPITG